MASHETEASGQGLPEPVPQEPAPRKPGLKDKLTDKALNFINEVDDADCASRVEKLRRKYPDATPAQLADRLIAKKARKTGAVGAVTASPAAVPGLGTVTALTFGTGVDITLTYTLQAELVLEIAYCYGVTLSPEQRRNTLLLVTGVSVGASRLFTAAGKRLAAKAGTQFAERSVLRALPIIGIGASAGINMASTYAVGKRAVAYFSMDPAEREGWAGSARAVTGVDERKLLTWLRDAPKSSWDALGRAVRGAGDKLADTARGAAALLPSRGQAAPADEAEAAEAAETSAPDKAETAEAVETAAPDKAETAEAAESSAPDKDTGTAPRADWVDGVPPIPKAFQVQPAPVATSEASPEPPPA